MCFWWAFVAILATGALLTVAIGIGYVCAKIVSYLLDNEAVVAIAFIVVVGTLMLGTASYALLYLK